MQVTIDTIFICFCEDYERNDGDARPYFMSLDLKEFIEQTKIESQRYGYDADKNK